MLLLGGFEASVGLSWCCGDQGWEKAGLENGAPLPVGKMLSLPATEMPYHGFVWLIFFFNCLKQHQFYPWPCQKKSQKENSHVNVVGREGTDLMDPNCCLFSAGTLDGDFSSPGTLLHPEAS